jgi:UDP-N-acetylglucosamine 1-carboxyvinyltransferase
MGVELQECVSGVRCRPSGRLHPVGLGTDRIDTDLGPLFAVLMSLARGTSRLREVVWERRFRYAAGLRAMGGRNHIDGDTLIVDGVPGLHPARVRAQDLRGAAALLTAALAAPGCSRVSGCGHLRRGYTDLPQRLNALGAAITADPLETSCAS